MKAILMYMFLLIEAIQGKGKCIMIEAEEEFIILKYDNCMIEKISVWKNPPNIKEEV
jgi:hypothetical protein